MEPYLALLLELQGRGHTVRLIGTTNFADAARKAEIAFAPLQGDFRALLGSPAGLELLQGKPVRLVNDALLLRGVPAGHGGELQLSLQGRGAARSAGL